MVKPFGFKVTIHPFILEGYPFTFLKFPGLSPERSWISIWPFGFFPGIKGSPQKRGIGWEIRPRPVQKVGYLIWNSVKLFTRFPRFDPGRPHVSFRTFNRDYTFAGILGWKTNSPLGRVTCCLPKVIVVPRLGTNPHKTWWVFPHWRSVGFNPR